LQPNDSRFWLIYIFFKGKNRIYAGQEYYSFKLLSMAYHPEAAQKIGKNHQRITVELTFHLLQSGTDFFV
jgi:hypothetical protein